jgi:ADP-ribosylglycohydrolase
MKKLWLLLVLAIMVLPEARAQAIKVKLNAAEFRDRVYACWMGKNIGGTLGMPFEGKREPHDITFYTNLKPGEPAPNDDLDLQLLWLKAMEEHGGRVDARILGDYWLKFVPVNWNEYGIGKKNMRRGFLPPLSGQFQNEKWRPSNGAWIRSEIWACLAPGVPALAARMAREDACVDHGADEGTLAEIFMASLESAAFVEPNRDRLIDIGLGMVPRECGLARAVRAARAAYQAGKDWKAAREEVIRASEDTGWFQAPRNVAFTILGWLYGQDDFGKSLCTAVNCGDDTDCTGATLGSIWGILHGTSGIPGRWSEPIGTKIVTVAVKGFETPKDIGELRDRTVAMTRRVLAANHAPVAIVEGPSDLRRAGKLRLVDRKEAARLARLSPYRIVWNEEDVQVTVDYVSEPVIRAGTARPLKITVKNLGPKRPFVVALNGLPAGWTAEKMDGRFTLGHGGSRTLAGALTTSEARPADYQMSLEVIGGKVAVRVPLTFVVPAPARAANP